MSEQYILRIGSDGEPKGLLIFDAQISSFRSKDITQWNDVELKQKPLSVLLPATWMYQSKTEIASKNHEVLQKSIPFAIEEELSNDVEDNYYAFQSNDSGGQDVIAIEKQHLDAIANNIKLHKLTVSGIYSEFAWLPIVKDKITLWRDDEQALVRFGQNQVLSINESQINQLIPMFKGDLSQVTTNRTTGLDLPELSVDNKLTELTCCQFLLSHQQINLYLDEIKEKRVGDQSESWRSVVVLLLVLLVSWFGIQFYQMYKLNQDIEDLKHRQQSLLLQAFPDAVAVEMTDPYAAIKSRLQLSTSQNKQQKSMLLDMIYHMGMVAKLHPQLQLFGIRMVNNQMEIQVAAPNIALINDFHQQLQQSANSYAVQVGVNELTDGGIYRSILTVVPR